MGETFLLRFCILVRDPSLQSLEKRAIGARPSHPREGVPGEGVRLGRESPERESAEGGSPRRESHPREGVLGEGVRLGRESPERESPEEGSPRRGSPNKEGVPL